MKRIAIHGVVALVTFAIGIASANLGLVPRPAPIRQMENAVQQAAKDKGSSEAKSDPEDCPPAFEGRYSNYDYGYSVAIPDGMIGFGACITNHGFGIDLSNPTSGLWAKPEEAGFPKAYLSVDAHYHVEEWRSFTGAIKEEMSFLEEDKATDIRLLSRQRTRLSGLRATRFIIHYRATGEATVDNEVLAFRDGIIYTIHLTTPSSRYEKDKKIVKEMQKMWRLQPLP